MSSTFVRAGLLTVALVLANASFALAETKATPAPNAIAQTGAAATPTPNPLSVSGYFRSYYFTRQNASNNPGAQGVVNQTALNNAVLLHADYQLPFDGFYVGGSYFFADPFNGPCVTAKSHAAHMPCVSQKPPNTNPDDTLPDFILNTFPEAYLGYKDKTFAAKVGDQLFNTPWAPISDSRVKPAAYQGGDFAYTPDNWTFEVARILQFENRTSSVFTNQTLLTSFPAGSPGMAKNIFFQGGNGVTTDGFLYGRVGYGPKDGNWSVNGYLWSVTNLVNMYWGDAKYTWTQPEYKPFVALQGGFETNTGQSYIGKINSQSIGVQVGATAAKGLVLTAAFDYIPWQTDTVTLPSAWACSNSNFQVKPTTLVAGVATVTQTLAYFLPVNAAQCYTHPNGTTTIYYGGWASPYTDSYATDPFFTTQISQGMADRRAPGTSYKVAATWTSANKKWTFIASDAWYNYGNALAPENTNEWNLDGQYHFSAVTKGRYHGLLLRYRYAQRSQSNTFCGAADTTCQPGAAIGTAELGGVPLFKYNRAQLEYDF